MSFIGTCTSRSWPKLFARADSLEGVARNTLSSLEVVDGSLSFGEGSSGRTESERDLCLNRELAGTTSASSELVVAIFLGCLLE